MAALNFDDWQPRALLRALGSVEHPSLEPNLVLCAKTITVCWLVTGLVSAFPSVSAPWVAGLHGAPTWWPQLLAASSLSAALWLLFGRSLRLAAFAQAAVIVLGLLSSRAAFGYHRLFVASVLLSIAAAGPGWRGALPRLQVAVLYLGAGLDKALTSSWRDGTFLSSLVTDLAQFGRLWSPGGQVGTENLPAQVLASGFTRFSTLPQALSLLVISLELFLAFAFALRWKAAAWASFALHLGIMTFTGGTFGVFFHASLAATLLVLPSPRTPWLVLALGVAWSLPWFSPTFACLALLIALGCSAIKTNHC